MTKGPRIICALAALLLILGTQVVAARGKPGKFAYYVLALSWSPTYCETDGRSRKDAQCAGTRPYAFVLHGLWPQYAKGWPERCDTGKKPWVPREVIDSMLDIMPAHGLIIHQYKKHGTCSGLSPKDYFALSRTLFEQIRIPERYLTPRQYETVSPRQIEDEFLKANPDLAPEMIAIACGNQRRLREIRVCFSRERKPVSCGTNEAQPKLCKLDKVLMPPVRGQ